MQDKMILTRPRLLAAAIAGLMAAAAVPAMADAETDALKRELAEQRKLIEKLLADKEAKPAPVAAAPAAPAAVTSTPAVRIYGILDGGVEHLNNIGATKSGVTRMPSITATLPSRLGFAGTKDMGDGYKGIATLEIGYNTDDGTLGQGGRLFGRQLFAGVDTPFGAVTYGRQWSMMFHAMLGTDILGPNVYALGSMDPYLASMRYDNSVAWRGSFGGFSAGALYSFGRAVSLTTSTSSGAPGAGSCAGEVAGSKMCRGWSLMAKYDAPVWGVAGAIDEQSGGTGASAPFFNGASSITFTRAEDTDRRSNLGGYVKFGTVKLAGGWLGRKVDAAAGTTKSTAYYLGATAPITAKITLDGGLARMSSKAQSDNKTRTGTLYAVRAFYNLDKGLDAYAQVGHLTNSSDAQYTLSVGAGVSPVVGTSQTGEMVGLRYMF